MAVNPAFATNEQAAKAIDPDECALDEPSVPIRPPAIRDIAEGSGTDPAPEICDQLYRF